MFDVNYNIYVNQSGPKQISTVESYTIVGITDCINFKKINNACIGFKTVPFYYAFSINAFIVVEWLHGWIVTYGKCK